MPLPLNFTPASTPSKLPKTSDAKNGTQQTSPPRTLAASEISSPHELTAFVESLLEQLETKFDDMSTQILDRMSQMSTRVDSLEGAIQDIINGDIPQSPPPRNAST